MIKRPSIQKLTVLLILSGIACAISSFNIHPHNTNPGNTDPNHTHPKQRSSPLRTIIIDPGHGGFDPGTSGLFSQEKNVALAISMKLGKALQEEFPDMKIIYTRTTDIMPGNMPTKTEGLHYRAELANKSRGDLFICIHANNDGHSPGTYAVKRVIGHKLVGKKRKKRVPIYETYYVKNTRAGTESYIWKADRSGFKGTAIGQREESEGQENDLTDSTTKEAFDMTTPEAKIKAQLYEKKFFANSALFASLVEGEFVKAGRQSYGVKQRDEGIQVLQATGMPSVLIETGFLSNKEEEEFLNSEDGQNEIVRNIVDAFKHYKDTLEGKNTGNGDNSLRALGTVRNSVARISQPSAARPSTRR
ncbi:MAG TPA: N-acetylmuramoyl-L-alanine amidase [Puia sp.]|nr:N-acetylmuramoyl-L-alanine amidase [Puia sp.]